MSVSYQMYLIAASRSSFRFVNARLGRGWLATIPVSMEFLRGNPIPLLGFGTCSSTLLYANIVAMSLTGPFSIRAVPFFKMAAG